MFMAQEKRAHLPSVFINRETICQVWQEYAFVGWGGSGGGTDQLMLCSPKEWWKLNL